MPSWAGNIVTAMVKMTDAYLASIKKEKTYQTHAWRKAKYF